MSNPKPKFLKKIFLGEFENQKSVEISTEHDSSDFDAGIRNFASDDRWKMGGGEQSFSSSNQKTDSIIEQMSVVSSKNDSWWCDSSVTTLTHCQITVTFLQFIFIKFLFSLRWGHNIFFFQKKIMVATNTETESLEDALQIVKKEKWKTAFRQLWTHYLLINKNAFEKMQIVSFEPDTYELFIYL